MEKEKKEVLPMSILNNHEIPIGLGMALAQDLDAMQQFSSLSEAQKKEVIQKTHQVKSKQEMKNLVSNLAEFH